MSETPATERTWLNGLLFVLTVLTACYAGTWWSGGFLAFEAGGGTGADFMTMADQALRDPRLYPLSALYAAVLMTILLGHELGHYLTCRRYGLPATLPFFLPGPPFLGTFGAFIRIRAHIPFKRQLFDVGANGPLVGFALTLPALAVGLSLSKVAPSIPSDAVAINFGDPLLLKLLVALFFGPLPEGSTLVLHPIGWAGWAGLLVTAINLVPLGQLDGGHVAYAVLGRRARLLSRVMVGVLAVLGILFHVTWLVVAGLLLFFEHKAKTRLQHPPVFDEDAPLGLKRSLLGALLVVIFVLSFIPAPIRGAGLIDLFKGLL